METAPCVNSCFMDREIAIPIKYYVLKSRSSPSSSPPRLEALGADLAEARELDEKYKCIVSNSYFRAWQYSSYKCANMKIAIWCLARDGSVLQSLPGFAHVSGSTRRKPKAPMTVFVDETVIKSGMVAEELKQARLDGAKLWRALSVEDRKFWEKKAADVNASFAEPEPGNAQERTAFKLLISLHGEKGMESVIGMLRSVDHAQFSVVNSVDGGEPAVLAALRGALRSGVLETPFRSSGECVCEYWDAMSAAWCAGIEDYEHCMTCCDLGQNIFHVQFAHQLVMASTMLRVQERYECPSDELRGRCFTVPEYKAWERKENPAQGFKYYDKWPGFNVPGSVVKAALQEDELLPREQALKQVLGDCLSLPNFYVIGTVAADSSSLYHEVCHAMYEVNAAYRADADAELSEIAEGPMRRMQAYLRCTGYANVERILQDEVHAYLSEGDTLGCKASEVSEHTGRLQAMFSKHAGQLVHLLNDVLKGERGSSSSSEDD